ncbi:MAG: hypothetical protein LBU51_03165 [Bacteroidales bacterium]|jgi:hypothetical protein|nr:hypothetical protein [Bacteroidales bacterium]
MKQVIAGKLYEVDEQTNALIPVVTSAEEGVNIVIAGKLYNIDPTTNALIPVVKISGDGDISAELQILNFKQVAIWNGTEYIYVLLKELDSNTQALATDTYVDAKIADGKTTVFEWKGEIDTLPATANIGDIYKQTSDGDLYWWSGSEWLDFTPEVDLSQYYTAPETDSLISLKQDALNNNQINAVNSGITASKVTGYDANSPVRIFATLASAAASQANPTWVCLYPES